MRYMRRQGRQHGSDAYSGSSGQWRDRLCESTKDPRRHGRVCTTSRRACANPCRRSTPLWIWRTNRIQLCDVSRPCFTTGQHIERPHGALPDAGPARNHLGVARANDDDDTPSSPPRRSCTTTWWHEHKVNKSWPLACAPYHRAQIGGEVPATPA